MAAAARPLLEAIGAHYGRAVYRRSNGQAVITFIDKPVSWKRGLPELQSTFEPHYVRGLLDGDGCISGSRTATSFNAYLSLAYNPVTEPWVARFFIDFLSRNGIRYSDQGDRRANVRQIRCWGAGAGQVARLAYGLPGWAHPDKAFRARALIEGRPGDWPLHWEPKGLRSRV